MKQGGIEKPMSKKNKKTHSNNMNKINYLKIAVISVGLILMFSGCKSSNKAVSVTDKKQMQKQIGVPPEVAITLPCWGVDSDIDFLRENGQGKSKDRSMASDRAYQDALSRLASKLAGVQSMENMKVGVSTNADGEDFHDKMVTVSKEIAEANVAGYRTSCEQFTVDKQDGSYHCYVAIEFGKQKIVKQMYDAMSNNKLIKADYDFDRYMKAFDKDLQEYERKNQ